MLDCDVNNEASVTSRCSPKPALAERWGRLDFLVHAIAFSDKEELKGKYVETTRGNFLRTLEISCYSFTDLCRRAAPLMVNGGSLLTLTYYGAERVMPHYNVMGIAKAALEASVRYLAVDLGGQNIRVNAISAGPIKTLAAAGIGDFRYILKWNQYNSPLKRNVTIEDVGGSALYLLSDLAAGVSGEVHHVDCGYHVVGMKAVDNVAATRAMLGPVPSAAVAAALMAGNSFGTLFRFTTWGESHGPAIGVVVDGVPPRIPLAEPDIQHWLDRRKPGQSRFTTQRREPDQVKILSGVFEGQTTGTPIQLMIDNVDARTKDYDETKDRFRPGHADYTWWAKYGIRDFRGGRHARRRARPRAASPPARSRARSWGPRSRSAAP